MSLRPRFHNLMGFTEPEVTDLLQQLEIEATKIPSMLTNMRKA
jgi:hypothetical protein